MKKLTTTILDRKGNVKEIYVFVDDKTASVLAQFKNNEIYHQYILEVYKSQWSDYREETHNTSLEESIEKNGFDFSYENNLTELLEKQEASIEIRTAIAKLNKEQQWIIEQLYYKGKRAVDIAKELHISKSAVTQRIKVIKEQLKKILKNIQD